MNSAPVPDENDIVFRTYGIDYERLARSIYEHLFHGDWSTFTDAVRFWWDLYSIIAIVLSLIFFAGYIYAKIRMAELTAIQNDVLRDAEARWAARHALKGTRNARWELIQQKIAENNPESWRLAIIEADILLDETLTNAGYVGQTLGDKLKTANPQSFTTIQDAWEAHKVRNEIAHVGSDFVLTKKTAQDTIVRFERVFQEFAII
ncbi:MAG TPA: hypothetical protein VFS75_02010 [Candidatus Paceibacterota bacterium]|nr:hypothetical protein [Candidatus Paceibacterota bacterium]